MAIFLILHTGVDLGSTASNAPTGESLRLQGLSLKVTTQYPPDQIYYLLWLRRFSTVREAIQVALNCCFICRL
jgi:hypothetical protein